MRLVSREIRDVASWVVPHAERPQFSGTLLKRTRCPETSLKATLWPLAARFLTGKSLSELWRRPRAPACCGVAAGSSSHWPRSSYRSSETWGHPGQGLQAAGPLGAGLVTFPLRSLFLPHFTPSGLVIIRLSQLYFLCVICNVISTSMEKAMAPHSSTLAWKIPWMEEPGRLQSTGR